jgi:hypothetical protein
VLACRDERWREGYEILTKVAQQAEGGGNLPGIFYSCLGVCISRYDGRRREGMELCRYALSVQPKEPDNHLNIALVYLMAGRRKAALRAILDGLELMPGHERLRALHEKVGVRRKPPLPFLSRGNPLNVILGQLRHQVIERLEDRRERRAEEREARES